MRRILWLAPALLAAGFVASCGGDEEKKLSKVFIGPPWTSEESNEYLLSRTEDGEPYGTCTLQTFISAKGGDTQLNLLCGDGQNRDDATAQVDSLTLSPRSANRTQFQAKKNARYSFTSIYEPPIVRFVADENGKSRETERELPSADEASPDPGYYADESLLWLVRGIELRQGYEGSFQNVSAGTGQTFRVDLDVEGEESVKVPAGEFMAWKVRIRTSAVTQFAWVESESPHRLIKARIKGIQDVTYELVKPE